VGAPSRLENARRPALDASLRTVLDALVRFLARLGIRVVITSSTACLALAIVALSDDPVWAAAKPPSFYSQWGMTGDADGQFSWPTGVATDAFGNVYVVDTFNNRVQKFDASGGFLTKWGSFGADDGEFNRPRGIAVDSGGHVYVADSWNSRVQKFSASGGFLTKWGSLGSGQGEFNDPSDVAVDSAGNVYVSDVFNHRVQRFTPSGSYVSQFGTYGADDGELAGPQGLAVDGAGNVYVANTGDYRIEKFDSSGEFLASWGTFQDARGIATDSDGHVLVADDYRIKVFDSTGNLVTQWGAPGPAPGQFRDVYGITIDRLGNIYLADAADRIERFIPSVKISIDAPPTATEGSFVRIKGRLASSRTECISASSVSLMKGTTTLSRRTTTAAGAYRFDFRVRRRVTLHVDFDGKPFNSFGRCAGASSPYRTIRLDG
jgi:DNA-binding beta-propeller fold protein YncE